MENLFLGKGPVIAVRKNIMRKGIVGKNVKIAAKMKRIGVCWEISSLAR